MTTEGKPEDKATKANPSRMQPDPDLYSVLREGDIEKVKRETERILKEK